jgi:hypothetical protein
MPSKLYGRSAILTGRLLPTELSPSRLCYCSLSLNVRIQWSVVQGVAIKFFPDRFGKESVNKLSFGHARGAEIRRHVSVLHSARPVWTRSSEEEKALATNAPTLPKKISLTDNRL